MPFITQLIFIKKGEETAFQQFEDIAIPMISKYNGQLLLRIRPEENSLLEINMDKPYEVQLVQFNSDRDFENYMQDEKRKQSLYLKEQSIKSVLLIKGEQL
jgi:hypothetical protein